MALAEATHHTAPQGQRIAKVREEGRDEMNYALLHPGAASTQYLRWTTTGMCLPPGPHLLLRCGHRSRFQRHTTVHIVDILPFVHILDVPVPADGQPTGGGHAEAGHFDPAQVIDVPNMPHDRIPQKSLARGRTGFLPCLGPQKRDLRRTVQQIVVAVPSVPFLDDPAPQMVE